MSILFRRVKVLIAVPLVVSLWWFFLHRSPKPTYTTCNQLFSNVHKHIAQNAFVDREEEFVGIWASTGALERETCSFYSFHRREEAMILGFKYPSGEISTQQVMYKKGEDGVVSYSSYRDPTNTLGYIYPVYYDDFPAIGNIICTDTSGFAEWKATISVPLPLLRYPSTLSIVSQGIQTFQRLAPLMGVDIHLGDYYSKPCWQAPVWGRKKLIMNETD